MKTVAIVSGGMDSVTLAYDLHANGHALHVLSVDYGQRHRRELVCAEEAARRLGARWDLVDLRALGATLLAGSALTTPEIAVPHGHYAAPTMAATVVPNRNAILLSLAYGLAVSVGAEHVAIAVHAGDHPVYPDCRAPFLDAFDTMECYATEGYRHPNLHILAPYVTSTKADIARFGERFGVPWHDTWSCYEGGAIHCGRCSTCVERLEALHAVGATDLTPYADPDYWRTVTLPGDA